MDIDQTIKEFMEEKLFGKEFILEAKTVLTWLEYGKEEAVKVSEKAVNNLVKCGFQDEKTKKLLMDASAAEDGEGQKIWFLTALYGAKGLVKQAGREVN